MTSINTKEVCSWRAPARPEFIQAPLPADARPRPLLPRPLRTTLRPSLPLSCNCKYKQVMNRPCPSRPFIPVYSVFCHTKPGLKRGTAAGRANRQTGTCGVPGLPAQVFAARRMGHGIGDMEPVGIADELVERQAVEGEAAHLVGHGGVGEVQVGSLAREML